LVNKYSIPVSFVNVAAGSTNTEKWNPEKDFLFNRIREVLESRKVKAILWHQGESDFMEKIPMAVSYDNMKKMINESRKIDPEVKWFIALNSMKTNQPVETIDIRKAQNAIIESGLAFRGPDTDMIRTNDKWIEPTGAEFVGEGLKRHGELWFEVLSNCLESVKEN
jgi:eukaryotic-like serine/threonine-protein kinase